MVIVTGGEGFIGKALIEKLKDNGYDDVISLDIKSYTMKDIHKFINKRRVELLKDL